MNPVAALAWVFGLALFVIVAIWGAVRSIRWAKKGTKGGSVLGWGLLLPVAGMNPQPPPQQQVDVVTKATQLKKDDESGDPEEGPA